MDFLSAELICPLTHRVFDDPHVLPCGHTFSKEAVSDWVLKNNCCPSCERPGQPALPARGQVCRPPAVVLQNLAPNFQLKEALRRYRSRSGPDGAPVWRQRWAQVLAGCLFVLEATGHRVVLGALRLALEMLQEVLLTLFDASSQWLLLSDGLSMVLYTLCVQLPIVAPVRILLLPVLSALLASYRILAVIVVSACVVSLLLDVRLPQLERAGFLPLALWRDRHVIRRKAEARARRAHVYALRGLRSELLQSGTTFTLAASVLTLASYALLALGVLLGRLGLAGAPALQFRGYVPFLVWPAILALSLRARAATKLKQ